MRPHDTPPQIANLLAKHAPPNLGSLLDPAVGNGALLRPFLLQKASPVCIYCVEKDWRVGRALQRRFHRERNVHVVRGDFLEWSSPGGSGYEKRFDCIVMNPPFAARGRSLVDLEVKVGTTPSNVAAPVEAAFILSAISLLRPGGRLLAIVPSSIVCAQSTAWLRDLLVQSGAVRLVHELPSGTFEGVDTRAYAFVYDHNVSQRDLIVCNHRIEHPNRITVSVQTLTQEKRFDYSFHEALRWHTLLRKRKDLRWTAINQLAEVARGPEESPIRSPEILHSTNWEGGVWQAPKKRVRKRANNTRYAERGDILMKRVSRGCAKSLGLFRGPGLTRCSDCVLIIRPRHGVNKEKLLFSMRVVMSWTKGGALIEQGGGASYVSSSNLSEIHVPIALADKYPVDFRDYVKALTKGDFRKVLSVEDILRLRLTPDGNILQ
jgi:hypothetical protein